MHASSGGALPVKKQAKTSFGNIFDRPTQFIPQERGVATRKRCKRRFLSVLSSFAQSQSKVILRFLPLSNFSPYFCTFSKLEDLASPLDISAVYIKISHTLSIAPLYPQHPSTIVSSDKSCSCQNYSGITKSFPIFCSHSKWKLSYQEQFFIMWLC